MTYWTAVIRRGFVFPLLLTVTLTGCGVDTDGKRAVSGDITLQGTPLDQGTIAFFVGDVPTPTAECLITDGKYALPAEQGLLPGKYVVRIRSTEEVPITPDEYAAGKTAPPGKERIPERYNTATEQAVDVPTIGTTKFDFRIE